MYSQQTSQAQYNETYKNKCIDRNPLYMCLCVYKVNLYGYLF